MPTLAIATLRDVTPGQELVRYLHEVDATLKPFGGRFLVHGAEPTVLEGDGVGQIVIIAFPDRALAEAWYASEAYQAILPLRLRNAACQAVLVDTVGDDYRAAPMGDALQAALSLHAV